MIATPYIDGFLRYDDVDGDVDDDADADDNIDGKDDADADNLTVETVTRSRNVVSTREHFEIGWHCRIDWP